MNRRRFFGWAAGMLGAGLFLGTRREPEKPGFVPYPWCGLGRGQNHRPHLSDKDGWAYCTVSCWACEHNLDMQRKTVGSWVGYEGPRQRMYTAEGKRVFPSGQKARDFYDTWNPSKPA